MSVTSDKHRIAELNALLDGVTADLAAALTANAALRNDVQRVTLERDEVRAASQGWKEQFNRVVGERNDSQRDRIALRERVRAVERALERIGEVNEAGWDSLGQHRDRIRGAVVDAQAALAPARDGLLACDRPDEHGGVRWPSGACPCADAPARDGGAVEAKCVALCWRCRETATHEDAESDSVPAGACCGGARCCASSAPGWTRLPLRAPEAK